MTLPVSAAAARALSPRARDYLGRRGSPPRRAPLLELERGAVVRVDHGTRTLRATIPRRLARRLGWQRGDYLDFALTPDGRALVLRFLARL